MDTFIAEGADVVAAATELDGAGETIPLRCPESGEFKISAVCECYKATLSGLQHIAILILSCLLIHIIMRRTAGSKSYVPDTLLPGQIHHQGRLNPDSA